LITEDIKGAKAYIDTALETLKADEQQHTIGDRGTFRARAQTPLTANIHPLHNIHGFRFNANELVAIV